MNAPRFRFPPARHTARTLALQVLIHSGPGEAYAPEVLDRELAHVSLTPADRRLATQLVYGTVRRRGTLDALLRPLLTRGLGQVEPWLREALRLGVYQLTLLRNIPAHAAIFETVELAAQFGQPRAKGFLNGVLRAASKLVTDQFADRPGPDALPQDDGRYRRLSRPVLPEPARHPVEYVAAGFGLPAWLVERWLARDGWDECLRRGFWFSGPAPLWLRVNRLRTTRDAYAEALRQAGIGCELGDHPQAIRLTEHRPVRELPGFAEGWFAVQDESAMRAASALAPAAGWRVLDLCSAPGGKTTQLAELMGNQGEVVACDIEDARLETVRELCGRLGVSIVCTHRLEPDAEPPPGPFDAALVDAPCSNTGVLGRRPEVRWRLRPRDINELVVLQTKLLRQATERVGPGGVVMYSTCSVEPDENQQVVRAVLEGRRDVELEAEATQVPGRPSDGGYWARLRHRG